MPRRKIHKRHIRNIQRSRGGTYLISIPVDVMRKLKWQERQKVEVKLRGKTITIKDWKK
jgi:antitoxin component of MazEF toxin-antitoxin module